MKILRIPVSDADFVALRDLAHRDRRDPRMQARVILERAVARQRPGLRSAPAANLASSVEGTPHDG